MLTNKSFFVVELRLMFVAITNLVPFSIHLCTSTFNRKRAFFFRGTFYVCLISIDSSILIYLLFGERPWRAYSWTQNEKHIECRNFDSDVVVVVVVRGACDCTTWTMNGAYHLHLSHQFMQTAVAGCLTGCERPCAVCDCVHNGYFVIADWMISYVFISFPLFVSSSFDHKSKSQ